MEREEEQDVQGKKVKGLGFLILKEFLGFFSKFYGIISDIAMFLGAILKKWQIRFFFGKMHMGHLHAIL